MENLEQIKSLLSKITGISAFSERQAEYITVWVKEWEMSAEDIVSAYHVTIDRQNKVDFRYWNAVLKARYEERLISPYYRKKMIDLNSPFSGTEWSSGIASGCPA